MSKKHHTRLITYYNLGATLPFCLIALAGLFLSALHQQDPKYVSEYFIDDGFGQTVFLHVMLSLSISLLSYPIFFNVYKVISDNFIISLLTWFCLPALLLSYSIYKFNGSSENLPTKYEGNGTLDFFFVFIVLAHSLALIISFYKFRRVLARTAALHS
ncbi:MAG: hypothetical protein QM737_19000 [Ferruginibacter sp.]